MPFVGWWWFPIDTKFITEDTIKELVTSVLLQAISDWEALNYGEFKAFLSKGEVVHRSEVLYFLQSKEFEAMVKYVIRKPIREVREALKVPPKGV